VPWNKNKAGKTMSRAKLSGGEEFGKSVDHLKPNGALQSAKRAPRRLNLLKPPDFGFSPLHTEPYTNFQRFSTVTSDEKSTPGRLQIFQHNPHLQQSHFCIKK
jgi:hypothetical protein